MTKKHLMIAVDWFGPYNDMQEAQIRAREDYAHGLYLCIGKCAYERKQSMQYIGIGKNLYTRIKEDHHKMSLVIRDRQLWLGEIVTAEPSGKKIKITKATLDYAEWLHARFLRLPLNENKTKSLPPQSVTVLNRWWRTDYSTIRKQRPHPDWPDLIDFPSYELPARAVWFGKTQRTFLAPEYAKP